MHEIKQCGLYTAATGLGSGLGLDLHEAQFASSINNDE